MATQYGQPDFADQPRRKGIVDSLMGMGGSVGPMQQTQPASAPVELAPPVDLGASAAPPAVSALKGGPVGKYGGQLEGFNTEKLGSKEDPKYDMARALSNFDPRQGVTPDVLKALNDLGIGQFSGSGDKVSIANGDPRFGPVKTLDLVHGFHDPNGTGGWQYGVQDNEVGAGPAPGGVRAGGAGMPSFGGSTINPMLQSDAQANVQQALGAFQKPGYLQQLIAQLGGGQ